MMALNEITVFAIVWIPGKGAVSNSVVTASHTLRTASCRHQDSRSDFGLIQSLSPEHSQRKGGVHRASSLEDALRNINILNVSRASLHFMGKVGYLVTSKEHWSSNGARASRDEPRE